MGYHSNMFFIFTLTRYARSFRPLNYRLPTWDYSKIKFPKQSVTRE